MKQNYSKRTWIITAVLAVLSIIVDVLIWLGIWGSGHQLMKDSAVLTIVVSVYILFVSIKEITNKVKEEKKAKEKK